MQNNISARTAHCFVHFFAVTARLRMKFSLATFYGGLKHMTNFSFFPNLGVVLKNSFQGNGSQTWASLSFVPPAWGANSSQSCRSCSFCSHKQRCWTVLSELRYKAAYNPNIFFLNWKQRTAGKAVEDALQYIKMYVAEVWTKTAKGYFKNIGEQVIRRQSKVWSNL